MLILVLVLVLCVLSSGVLGSMESVLRLLEHLKGASRLYVKVLSILQLNFFCAKFTGELQLVTWHSISKHCCKYL